LCLLLFFFDPTRFLIALHRLMHSFAIKSDICMKRKIHVVEDQMIIQLDLCHLLKELGYEVVNVAVSYEQTLEQLAQLKPDLLILDILLKGDKTGIDIAHEVNRLYQIPFVYLTSHSDFSTVEKAHATFPKGYILKPFTRNEIATTLAEIFEATN
jgi:two-component system response regulator LytT